MDKPTEEQIRAHLKVLKGLVDTPCNCRTRKEQSKCRKGRAQMMVTIHVLEWVLMGSLSYDELAAELAGVWAGRFKQNRIVRFEKEEPTDG